MIQLQIEDVSALRADEQNAEDEISDPDEDSLAGQVAAMKGGAVKKNTLGETHDDDDDDSTTDDDKRNEEESSSDSDSD